MRRVHGLYCAGIVGGAIASAYNLEVSGRCAPSADAPIAAAFPNLRHLDWFADQVRLEPELLDAVRNSAVAGLWPKPRKRNRVG